MQFTILDSAGNALASFEDDLTARAVMHAIVAVEPEASEQIAMLRFGDDGMPIGDAVMPIDVAPPVEVESEFIVAQFTSGALREPVTARTLYRPLVAAGIDATG
jgi:hypothetical protein